MMLGERSRNFNPTIEVPQWPMYDDPAAAAGVVPYTLPIGGVSSPRSSGELSPYFLGDAALTALQRFLPSNEPYVSSDLDADDSDLSDAPIDAYSCDEFRIYEFKVRRCARGRSHDWTECPYAHPGEKARRRDPRKYHYSGTACPDFRKGNCKRGDSCEFAHGVFECWLHPARYRTQPCKDGTNCRRRVCFFAHTPEQLRILPQSTPQSPRAPAPPLDSYDGSPLRQHHGPFDGYSQNGLMSSSPTSTLISPPISPPSESPPRSPSVRRGSFPPGSSVNELLLSLRQLQLSKAKSVPSSWGTPSRVIPFAGSGMSSLPSTPTRMAVMGGGGVSSGCGLFDGWEEEPVQRVESGRDLRAMIAERLSKENSLGTPERGAGPSAAAPDVDWVSELVQ